MSRSIAISRRASVATKSQHQCFIGSDVSTGNYELFAFTMTGAKIAQLTNNPAYDNWQPRVSPDGKKILFIRTAAGTFDNAGIAGTINGARGTLIANSGDTTAYIWDTGSKSMTSLTLPFNLWIEHELVRVTALSGTSPDLTATIIRGQDGTAITAHGNNVEVSGGVNGSQLWTAQLDGSGLIKVLDLPIDNSFTLLTHPEWNPSGTEVLVLAQTITGNRNVAARFDATTTPYTFIQNQVSLANTESLADPIYSRNGSYIIFSEVLGGSDPNTSDSSVSQVDSTGSLSGDYGPNYKQLWHLKGIAAASTANVNIASAPASIDGYTLSNAQNVLLKNQTSTAENGVYTFNGTGSALTRSSFANTGAEFVGLAVYVRNGSTNVNTKWQYDSDSAVPTLDVSAISFVSLNRGVEANNLVMYDPTMTLDGSYIYCEYIASGIGIWDLGRIPGTGGRLTTILGDGALNSRGIPINSTKLLLHRKPNIFSHFDIYSADLDGSNLLNVSNSSVDTTYPSELGIFS